MLFYTFGVPATEPVGEWSGFGLADVVGVLTGGFLAYSAKVSLKIFNK